MGRADSLQAQDNTLRGTVYQLLARVYVAGWVLLSKATNHATIHSTKFSLLVLFSVTAFQPSVFNGILFIMFLLLSMANNSQMLFYWKITLVLVALILCSQYSTRVFATEELLNEMKQSRKQICLTGLIRCDKMAIEAYSSLEIQNMMLYVPYFVLLITFVLSYFIMTSDTYQSLLQHYIDKEVKM